ncbi:hypothetical protein BOX15_Mlig029498g2 [Macrostomum lignano]|uniref:Ig-like domain-containing protein n=1 Tax=Macrostomum lignano TaxID=282301 RepID=A0A267GNI2_9PLAT|nr:hypothetical protein BOX15_Mlig029498g2 [Macrostomum lignano]
MQDQGEYYCQVSESDSSRRSWPSISRKATLRVLRNVDTVQLMPLASDRNSSNSVRTAASSAVAVARSQGEDSSSSTLKDNRQQESVLKIRVGDPLTLACSASGSNPAAALVWLFGDGESAAADENRIRTPTVEGEAGRSAFYRPFSGSIRLEKRVESAVDKLWTVTSVLQIDSHSILDAHHNLAIRCEAQVAGFAERRKSLESRLYVLVPPQVQVALEAASGLIPKPSRELREHDNVIAVCRAVGRPEKFSYSWAIDEIGLLPDRTEARLPLTLTRGHNNKRLRCWAENFARREASVRLRVRYGPKFEQGLPELYAASVGTPEVTMSCRADSNPAPKIIWHRYGVESTDEVLSREPTLRLEDIRRSDFGQYLCSATAGGEGDSGFAPISRRVILAENDAPKISTAARHFARLAHNYRLECRINAIPLPPMSGGVLWMRNGRPLVMDARVRIYREDFLGGTTAIVHFDELFSTDFGTYNCSVSNGYGSDWQLIELVMEDHLPVAFIAGASIALLMVLIFVIVLLCVCRKGYWESRAAAVRESRKRDIRDVTDADHQKQLQLLAPAATDIPGIEPTTSTAFPAIGSFASAVTVASVAPPDDCLDLGSCGGGSSSGCGGSSTQLNSVRLGSDCGGGPAAFVPARLAPSASSGRAYRTLQHQQQPPSAVSSPPLPTTSASMSPVSLNLMELTPRHVGLAQAVLVPGRQLQQQQQQQHLFLQQQHMLIREEHQEENGQEDSVRSCDSGYGGTQQQQQQQQQQQSQLQQRQQQSNGLQSLHRMHGSDSSVDSSRTNLRQQQQQQQHHVTFHPTPCVIHHYQDSMTNQPPSPCPLHSFQLAQSPSRHQMPASTSLGSFVSFDTSNRRPPPPIVEDQSVSEV